MSRTQCYKWFNHFKAGRTWTDKDSRPGQPSASTNDYNIDAVHAMICENHRSSVWEIDEEMDISI